MARKFRRFAAKIPHPPVIHGRNYPVTLFAPLPYGSMNTNKRLPLAEQPQSAVNSTWGNGRLSERFRAQKSVFLG